MMFDPKFDDEPKSPAPGYVFTSATSFVVSVCTFATVLLALQKLEGNYDGTWFQVYAPLFVLHGLVAIAVLAAAVYFCTQDKAVIGVLVFIAGNASIAFLVIQNVLFVFIIGGDGSNGLGYYPDWLLTNGCIMEIAAIAVLCVMAMMETGEEQREDRKSIIASCVVLIMDGIAYILIGVRIRETFDGNRDAFFDAMLPGIIVAIVGKIVDAVFNLVLGKPRHVLVQTIPILAYCWGWIFLAQYIDGEDISASNALGLFFVWPACMFVDSVFNAARAVDACRNS